MHEKYVSCVKSKCDFILDNNKPDSNCDKFIIDLINKISDLINKTSLEDLGIFVIEESGYLKMLENEKNKSFKNGPLVCPGKYKAVQTLGEKKLETEFIISKDPKLSVSNQDLRNLELFQLKVIEKISEAKNLENKIEKMLSEKKLNKREKSLVLSVQQDMTTKEGTYMQPMLVAQYNYLYSMLSRSDQEIGNDAHLRLNELNERLEKNKKLINSVSP